ncbi:hypothetical protein DAI22_10g130201 [Oryza sativa Japonica Group]|nr:hypothetical protein DAI22_10g130201 [Oryza sativa Japonica Group]
MELHGDLEPPSHSVHAFTRARPAWEGGDVGSAIAPPSAVPDPPRCDQIRRRLAEPPVTHHHRARPRSAVEEVEPPHLPPADATPAVACRPEPLSPPLRRMRNCMPPPDP